MTDVHETKRWRGIVLLTLTAGAIGLISDRPELFVVAVVGVAYAAYPAITPLRRPELELERELSERSPRNGEHVDVTVTVRNAGEKVLPDVRFVDGVPTALSVVDGTPRRGMALYPGREVTFTYTVEAKRGKHRFQPATVVARDLSGARELETTVSTDTEIDCTVELSSSPVRPQTLDYVGRVLSDQVGRGVEFDRTREYKQGDERSRIDWNRFARTRQLTTIEFRSERAVNAMVLVDGRESAYRSSEDDAHAVGLCVSAAEQLFGKLLRDRNQVGIAAFGREFCWMDAGSGREHLVRAQQKLATHPAFHPTPPTEDVDAAGQLATLRERLSEGSQVVVVSPLCDDWIVTAAQTLDAHGYPVSVVSPDVTGGESVGQRLASVERDRRLSRLRSGKIPVVEWEPDVPLAVVMESTQERWLS